MVLLYKYNADRQLKIRKIGIAFQDVMSISDIQEELVQYNLFIDGDTTDTQNKLHKEREKKERSIQQSVIGIKNRFGKNAVLRGFSYYDCTTARERNNQIGGHRA